MQGYAMIAARMASLPQLAILRRFEALNLQNLLYLQAEIVELETELRKQAESDTRVTQEPERSFTRDWYTLSAKNDDGKQSEQWAQWLVLRERLEKYSAKSYRRSRNLRVLMSSRSDFVLPCISVAHARTT